MKVQLLATSVGPDRPGLVARITEEFVRHGANLEESRMAILGGEFAAIMLVSVTESSIPALLQSLEQLKADSITVSTKRTSPLPPDRFKNHTSYEMTAWGVDHEGIVHKVSECLRSQSVNIQTMDTTVAPAPVSGTPMFHMTATVLVPPGVPLSGLSRSLADIAELECVDIDVRSLEAQKAGG